MNKAIFNQIQHLGIFLEKLNYQKDKLLSFFIHKYWPPQITPNHLTIARIFIGIFLFILLFNFKNNNIFFIIPLFLIGILTDLLDGVIARCFKKETKFGIIADPIADRMVIFPVAIYSLISYPILLILLIGLEIINAVISLFVKKENFFKGSNIFGKTKMFIQSIVLTGILFFWPLHPNIFFIYLLWFSIFLMVISIIVKFISFKHSY